MTLKVQENPPNGILYVIQTILQVDIQFMKKFEKIITLKELKNDIHHKYLHDMVLFKQKLLSVQQVTEAQFNYITNLNKKHSID